ncbi:MAG: hypothetical protein H5T44_06190 [Thermoplasmatales archaeon]|nr:hypothetical protein [Thermoplasmatales archaeon]
MKKSRKGGLRKLRCYLVKKNLFVSQKIERGEDISFIEGSIEKRVDHIV